MFTLYNPITRDYWENTQFYILRHMNKGKWRWVGDVMCVECAKDRRAYAICDYIDEEAVPVAWVSLKRKRKWIAFEVEQTYVLKPYRGNRYAEKLYEAVVEDGQLLASGFCHTKYSKKLWARLVASDKLNIWAQDFHNLSRTSPVFEEDGKVICPDLDLYHEPYCAQDVRLLAWRK